MPPPISPLLGRHKLDASFDGTTVTHITRESNLEARQRLVEVTTVWKTEDRIGSGAFGVVWRQKADTGKLRAVKVIARDKLNLQEVEALIDLQDHPALFIQFSGWFENIDRDTIHLAMEYIEHGDLGKYIAEYKTKVEAREITSQILEGLVVLHEREICHRDLKPQNILVASLAPIWVKISDFGISKRWVGTSLKTHCGTAIYSSPEQLGILPRQYRASENSYTNNIDIWALGVIVHEMLTLQIPFLEPYTQPHSDLTLSFATAAEQNVDTAELYEYCKGAIPFPCDTLQRASVSADGIEFVKSLMVVNPAGRASAAVALASQWVQTRSVPQLGKSDVPTAPGPSRSTRSSETVKEEEADHGQTEDTERKVPEVFDRERRGGKTKNNPNEETRSKQQELSRTDDSEKMKIDKVRVNMTRPGDKFSRAQRYSSNKQTDDSSSNRDGYKSSKQHYSSGKPADHFSDRRDDYSSSHREGDKSSKEQHYSSHNQARYSMNGRITSTSNRRDDYSSRSNDKPSSSLTVTSTRKHQKQHFKKSAVKATAEAPVPAPKGGQSHAVVEAQSYDIEPWQEVLQHDCHVVPMAVAEAPSPVLKGDFNMEIDVRMEDSKMEMNVLMEDTEKGKDVPMETNRRTVHTEMAKAAKFRPGSQYSSPDPIKHKLKEADVPDPKPRDPWAWEYVPDSLKYTSSMEGEAGQSGPEESTKESPEPPVQDEMNSPIPMEVDVLEPNLEKSSGEELKHRIAMGGEAVRFGQVDSMKISRRPSSPDKVNGPIPMKAEVLEPKPVEVGGQSTSRHDTRRPQWQLHTPAQCSQQPPPEPVEEMRTSVGGMDTNMEECAPSGQPEMYLMQPERRYHEVWETQPAQEDEYSTMQEQGDYPVMRNAVPMAPTSGVFNSPSPTPNAYPARQEHKASSDMQTVLAMEPTSPTLTSQSRPPDGSHRIHQRGSYGEMTKVHNTEYTGALNSLHGYPVDMQTVPAMAPTSPTLTSQSRPPDGSHRIHQRGSYGEMTKVHNTEYTGALNSLHGYPVDTQTGPSMAPTASRPSRPPGAHDTEHEGQESWRGGPRVHKVVKQSPGNVYHSVTRADHPGTRQGDLEDQDSRKGGPRPQRNDSPDRRGNWGGPRAGQQSQFPQAEYSTSSNYDSNESVSRMPGTGRGGGKKSSYGPVVEYDTPPVLTASWVSPYGYLHQDSDYWRPQEVPTTSRPNVHPYYNQDNDHHQYPGPPSPVTGARVVQSPIPPLVVSDTASGTSPLLIPTRPTDKEGQPRWRQWVDGLKESLHKAVRK